MIRKVEPSDASDIAAIYNEYVCHTDISFETEPVSEDAMGARIKQIAEHYPYWVFVEEDHIVGYCYAHPWKERAAYGATLETTIYLSPHAKGRGIGLQLMTQLIESARKQRFHALIACITDTNQTSCAFHKALGFQQVSHFKEVGHKLGKWIGVIDYQLIL